MSSPRYLSKDDVQDEVGVIYPFNFALSIYFNKLTCFISMKL